MTEDYIPSSKSTVCCLKCKSTVTLINFSKHYDSKQCQSGGKFKTEKLTHCKHCNQSFSEFTHQQIGSHSRWCKSNPKSEIDRLKQSEICKNRKGEDFHIKDIESWKDSLSKARERGCYTEESYKKSIETRRRNGNLLHTEESKQKMSVSARNSKHQRICKKSHKFVDKIGREFIFDSSWEDAMAIRLDELSIYWIRPNPIEYNLNGKKRNYFPDFYLPEYDLYLDPKNPYCIKVQKEKLDIVSNQINLLILESIESCKNFTL